MKIAMLGTRGVPAQYGGFETAVEEIGSRLVKLGLDVVVYCSNPHQTQREYLGMRLVNLPALRKRTLETLSHTGLSILHLIARDRPDVVFLFNAANAPFLPVLRTLGIPTAVHLDGLEWKRAKWNGLGKSYFRSAERWSVRLADAVVADARGIGDHVRENYDRESVFIPYGAPIIDPGFRRLPDLGLRPRSYHLVVARFEPENHVDVIIEGYIRSPTELPLVVVGSEPYANQQTTRIRSLAAGDPRVRLLGSVWDQLLLDELYANSAVYWHGHSVGGTNPSLLRAMGSGAPVNAFDVRFNREVAGDCAQYFSHADDVSALLAAEESVHDSGIRGARGRSRVADLYQWDEVAASYLALAETLVAQRGR